MSLLVIAVLSLCMALLTWSFSPAAREKTSPVGTPEFGKPITSDPTTWLGRQVQEGRDIYLSANYLFQAMKLRSQKVLMEFEAETLLPSLMEVMDGLKQAGVSGEALVYVEMARKILTPGVEVNPALADKVQERLDAFMNDPRTTPRGHYASSEELKRYFQGMQFLTRATFDAKIDRQWFAQSLYMLFPFDAAVQIVRIVSNPSNSALKGRIGQLDDFYTRLVGGPDLPTFRHLLGDESLLEQQAVLAFAKKNGLPRINKGMGVGVQCLGERFTAHQLVIDTISEKFLAPDPTVNRQKAFQALRVRNILLGSGEKRRHIPGLGAVKVSGDDPKASYYALSLTAINALPGKLQSPYQLNAASASLTALAEQTILVTKQSTLVGKSSSLAEEKRKKPVNVYIQAGIEKFLRHLHAAEAQLFASCGRTSADEVYAYLEEASKTGKPVKSDSPQGSAIMAFACPLAMDPTVTADVFFFVGRTDKAFLQWAVGPFEVEYALPNKAKAVGMEMVFFEGWHDALRKGAKTPMTNEEWRGLFQKGQYTGLHYFIAGRK